MYERIEKQSRRRRGKEVCVNDWNIGGVNKTEVVEAR